MRLRKMRIKHHLNKNNNLLKHSLVILIGSTIVNILNYLYQLFMGRMLGPADYSVLGALFSIIYIVTFSFGAVRTVIVRFTSAYFAKKEYGKARWLLSYSLKRLGVYGLIGLVVFGLLSPSIASYLGITQAYLVLLLGAYLFFSLLLPAPMGIITGLQRFGAQNIVGILGAVLKILLGVIAVFLGTGLFGVMVALDLMSVLIFFISLLALGFLFKHSKKEAKAPLFSYSVPAFIGLTILNLFVNIDVLMAKHYFSSVDAGYYAALSMIGKMIFFASGALLMVMFPKVSSMHSSSEDTSGILKSTLFYTFLISSIAIALYYTAPTFIVNLMYGQEYKIASYIGMMGLAIGIFTISSVLVNYNLAISKTSFVYFLIPLFIFEVIGIMMFHHTLLEVIQVILVVNVIMLGYMLFVTRKALGFNFI